MAERHTIETYGRAPQNRNIWSTATERHTIETYGRQAGATPGRFFCLLQDRPLYHYCWFPRLRFCERCRDLEFTTTITSIVYPWDKLIHPRIGIVDTIS